MAYKVLDRLVGNTGDASQLTMVVQDSFSVHHDEFVRTTHQERKDEGQVTVLGRVTKISRTNVLYNADFDDGVTELELLPGASVAGENIFAQVELVSYRDPVTRQIRTPRRPLNLGTAVETVDFQFLSDSYEFNEHSSLHLGNLIGYDKGENTVPVSIDMNKLATKHLTVLAMTGSGESYTVGHIIERLVVINNGTVAVLDPHGEYDKALAGGNLQFSSSLRATDDKRDQEALSLVRQTFEKLQAAGTSIQVYSPQHGSSKHKYASKNALLALRFDHFEMDNIAEILPDLTKPQQRVLDVVIHYWRYADKTEPRDIDRLRFLLGDDIEESKERGDLSKAEAKALSGRSVAVASVKLSHVLNEAKSFYSAAMAEPVDIYKMVDRPSNQQGRLVVVDLQGLSDTTKQVVYALLSNEMLKVVSNEADPLHPCFIIYEKGHNFAPAGGSAVSHRIIKRIAGEGRKFGVGFGTVSQRPSRLDSDVTSQCNTLITMRLENPDDQRFIARASDMVSKVDLEELPSLSAGEALVCGCSIPAPLLVKVGSKTLVHGGKSPEVLHVWDSFSG